MEETQEKKTIELKPVGKWKRILMFLGDFFIAFIISFILFNAAIYPLSSSIAKTNKKNEEAETHVTNALNVLVDRGVLFVDKEKKHNLNNDVNYTFKLFLSYYAFDDVDVDATHPQYGHKIANEVIRTYYVGILNDEQKYLDAFNTVNKTDEMFEIGNNKDSISLKKEYKEILGLELLQIEDESKYSQEMTNLRDHVFGQLFYIHMYRHIQANDLKSGDTSFNTCMKLADDLYKKMQWTPVISSLISMFLGWLVAFIIYPMINKERRTITMSVMKLDNIDFRNLNTVSRGRLIIQAFYSLLFQMASLLFLPMLYFETYYVFNLPFLFILTVIAFALMLGSLIVLLFNQYNRSGRDVLSYSVVIPTKEIDNLYKEKLDEGRISS